MNKIQGGCHCGNISYVAELSNDPSTYHPRACDCAFCTAHGAAYVSDAAGSLTIVIKNKDAVSQYKQGSGICNFLVCRHCGVLTNVIYQENQHIFGSVNAGSLSNKGALGKQEAAHLLKLSGEAKTRRWKQIWFPGVTVRHVTT